MTGLAQVAVFCLIFGGSVVVGIGLVLVMTMDSGAEWAKNILWLVWIVFGWLFLIVGAVLGLITVGLLAFS